MARNSRRRRVTNDNASRRLHPSNSLSYTPNIPLSTLSHFEDRRQWHPEGLSAPAKSFSSFRHRLVVSHPVNVNKRFSRSNPSWNLRTFSWGPPATVAFHRPKKVLVCVRRTQRREVLHALKKTGRGHRRRPHYNYYSSISCRS